MDEFDFISSLMRPLAAGAPEAFGLADDAAVLPGRPGWDLVVTTDTIVEGVHFLPSDPLDLVARKLLRVNLSDLAAKGAEPYGYFLNTVWPHGVGEDGRRLFARGLAEDQRAFGLKLFGGDTTSTPGPLTLSATMLGLAPEGRMVTRSGAEAGDLLFVSGTIGDGWLGLHAARGEASGEGADELLDRYRLPRPRLDLAGMLLSQASAAMDISDGLIADARRLAGPSGVRLRLDLDRVPLSETARRWLYGQDRRQGLLALASGGDDYEILCTAPPTAQTGLTCIGEVLPGEGVEVLIGGEPVDAGQGGWVHR